MQKTPTRGNRQITSEALTTTSLTGNVGSAPVTIQGQIHHSRSSQCQGELHLTFSDIPDQTVAPFFPEMFHIPEENAAIRFLINK